MQQYFSKTVALLLSLLVTFHCTAQKQTNNWLFGNKVRLNFNSGTAVFQPGGLQASEGCSSISDSAGNLLFSTNGTSVWNRNDVFMGNIGPSGIGSSSQAALIVPHPGNDSLYYVFISAQIEFTATNGIMYGIVNMKMNGGLGGIMQPFTTLFGGVVHEKLAAIKHKNGSDIWLLGHEAGSNRFLEYKITSAGLNSTVIPLPSGGTTDGFLDRMGYLKFSADGSRIAMACTNSRLELFNFDNQTGLVSDAKMLPRIPNTNCRGFYGVEFSCDSKLLYTSYFYLCSSGAGMCYLLQYKIDYTDVNDIVNSMVFLDSAINSAYNYGALQMSPEGRIMVSAANKSYIGAILKPNVYGTGCLFVPQYLTFPNTANCALGLPNMVQSYYNLTPSINATGNCLSRNVSFKLDQLNLYDSIHWDFGDPASGTSNMSTLSNPSHLFSVNGFYKIINYLFKKCKIDTLQKLISVGDTHSLLGNDTDLCPGSIFTLRVSIPGASYEWQDGSTTDSFRVLGPGIYWLKIKLIDCFSIDSLTVRTKPLPLFTLGNDTSICETTTLRLDVTGAGDSYLWQDGSTAPSYLASQAGLYFVRVSKDGCIKYDSINISLNQIPRPDLGTDVEGCLSQPILLDPGNFEGNYLWQDGSTLKTYAPLQSGLYSVAITNKCGFGKDEINITLWNCNTYFPSAFTPNKDGKNDEFKMLGNYRIKRYNVKVFNRYGQLLFETNDPVKGWDGNYRNKQLAGSYAWIASFTDMDGRNFLMKGNVVLIR